MAITKLPRSGIADNSINASKIEDGTVAITEVSGTISNAKLKDGEIANAKLSNSTITIRGTSRALGTSVTIGVDVDWQSVITGDTTMAAGRGYFVNTTSGAISMTLPSSASVGDTIAIKDYAGTFASNNLTILRNSHNIQGVANDSRLSTNRASIVLVYVDATKGWLYTDEHNVGDLQKPKFTVATGGTITTDGDYKIHVFTGDGNFVIPQVGNLSALPGNPLAGPNTVEYFVVAGGGSGASGNAVGGGGGAGGYRTNFPTACGLAITATTFPVTVGAGGGTTTAPNAYGNKGSDSIFSTITSAGGGASFGAPVGPGLAPSNANGGSGGGPNYNGSYPNPFGTNPSTHSVFPASTKGLGNTPPVSPSQGNNSGGGGFNDNGPTSHYGGGGGGGAGGAGGNFNVGPGGSSPTPLHAGDGGNGAGTSIFPGPIAPSYGTPGPSGPLRYFSGGGGAGGQGAYDSLPPLRAGIGGYGGGGCASACRGTPGSNPWYPRTSNAPGWSGVNGESGATNTGGGGGAGGKDAGVGSIPGPGLGTGGGGGKGIVVIRYKFQ